MLNMLELQNLLSSENKDVYIMGDMNIDLLKFKEHRKTGEYLENLFSSCFLPLITKPTRVSEHSATLIDHICTNKQHIDATSGIVITDMSDHFGIFSTIRPSFFYFLDHEKNCCKKIRSVGRVYKK